MKEHCKIKEIDIKGSFKIELFDAETGEKCTEVSDNNFIAYGLKELLKNSQKNNIATFNPFNQSMDGYTNSLITHLILSTCTHAENQEKDCTLSGDVVGRGIMNGYTGPDLSIGTLRTDMTIRTEEFIRFVWDFANDRANGTINSIQLANSSFYIPKYSTNWFKSIPLSKFPMLDLFPRQYSRITEGGGYYWCNNNSNLLWMVDKETKQELAQFTLPSVPSSAIYYHNGIIWYSSDWSLYAYNISNGQSKSFSILQNRSINVSFKDNKAYFFGGTTFRIFELDYDAPIVSTPFILNTVLKSTGYCDNDRLFLYDNEIYSLYDKPDPLNNNVNRLALVKFNGSDSFDIVHFVKFLNTPFTIYGTINGIYYTIQGGVIRLVPPELLVNPDTMGLGPILTRRLLSNPIVKDSTKTMRITYQLNFPS